MSLEFNEKLPFDNTEQDQIPGIFFHPFNKRFICYIQYIFFIII